MTAIGTREGACGARLGRVITGKRRFHGGLVVVLFASAVPRVLAFALQRIRYQRLCGFATSTICRRTGSKL